MTLIHPTAIIDPQAQLDESVIIGPYCCVGPNVRLGKNVRLMAHVYVDGHTTIGAGTVVYPFASLGAAPQDLKYKDEPTELIIGENNQIREHATMNPGTKGGKMVTRVGNNCLFMVGTHVAHDCVVGNNVILANNATLAGHVEVGDYAILGGLSAVQQFVRIGAHAMIGGMSGVEADVIPYGLVKGERAWLAGLNLVGLERRGFSKEEINALRTAFRSLFNEQRTLAERLEEIKNTHSTDKLVQNVIAFLMSRTNRPITLPRQTNTHTAA